MRGSISNDTCDGISDTTSDCISDYTSGGIGVDTGNYISDEKKLDKISTNSALIIEATTDESNVTTTITTTSINPINPIITPTIDLPTSTNDPAATLFTPVVHADVAGKINVPEMNTIARTPVISPRVEAAECTQIINNDKKDDKKRENKDQDQKEKEKEKPQSGEISLFMESLKT